MSMQIMDENDFLAITGLSSEELKENIRLMGKAAEYIDKPIEDWPKFNVLWDLDPQNYFYVLDADKKDSYKEQFPEGLILGKAKLAEIDSRLCERSKRTIDETWTIGDPNTIAKLIVEWDEGKKITPPLLEVYNNGNTIFVGGGNHRLAVCRAVKLEEVTFLAIPEQKYEIEKILKTVNWL